MATPDVVANLTSLQRQSTAAISPADLASAFGWSREHLRQREIESPEGRIGTARAFLGGIPAALFATPTTSKVIDIVDEAALYGYHAAVRWGVAATADELTVFNSHWLRNDRWFRFAPIKWDELAESRELLEALQPTPLIEGNADRLALQQDTAPSFLQPVDEELVERLDAWRDEAMKSSKSQVGVDEQLQILFAKLFVLRTIEDRGLAPSVTTLQEGVTTVGDLDVASLARTFEEAKRYIGSELFDNVDLHTIPRHVIAGVIGDLYKPRKLPNRNARYNFAWIDSDVLGLAYEKYLSTILSPQAPSPQMELFNPTYRNVLRVSVRRSGGVYYTPSYLTKYLATQSIIDFRKKSKSRSIPKVIDFACGSGSFLVAALDVLLEDCKAHDPSKNWGRELVEGGFINGVDVDEKAVTVARLNLWNRLAEEPDPLPLPNLSRIVVQGDGLDSATWKHLNSKYDVVLGNPPFLATSRVGNREQLETRFETAKGRYDYSYLFVEQAIKVTEPNGSIGMVIPNRLFKNTNAGPIREYLTKRMDVSILVDFGSTEVFQNTAAYVGCLVAHHRPLLADPAPTLQVVDVAAPPEQLMTGLLLDGTGNQPSMTGQVKRYEALHPRGPQPWHLLSVEQRREQVRLSDASVRLDEVANIYQGIRTGANEIFIFEIRAEDELVGAELLNGLGDAVVLERNLLKPVVFGSEIQRFSLIQYNKYMLYPYIGGNLVSLPEMKLRYPRTFAYLEANREVLAGRSSIESSGLSWYELVRRRDEAWLTRPKLMIRDLAPEVSFAADVEGKVYLVGGTAVCPSDDTLVMPLLAYLNSKPINEVLRRLTPQFRGGFQKFEPRHLQAIPVVRRLLEDEHLSGQLRDLAWQMVGTISPNEQSATMLEIDNIVHDAMSAAAVEMPE